MIRVSQSPGLPGKIQALIVLSACLILGAADAQETPDHLVSALKKRSAENLSNLTPHPLPVLLNSSHPPVLQRIKALRRHGA